MPRLLPAALLALGLAVGLSLGLATRPLRAGEAGGASISGPGTEAGAAPPRAPATAFPPVARPEDDEGESERGGREVAPSLATSTATMAATGNGGASRSPEAVTRAAVRSALRDLARVDAPLAASLEALLAAVRAPALPEGTTRGAITGRVFRANAAKGEGGADREGEGGGAPLEGARVAALPEARPLALSGLPWTERPVLERERALVDLAVAVQALRTARDLGGAAVTGPDGAYEVGGLAVGAYTIAGTSPGRVLEPASTTAEARPGERVDLVARPGRVVVVRAVLPSGDGAGGASVSVWVGARRFEGEADARGIRAVEVPAEPIRVWARHHGRGETSEGLAMLDVREDGPAPVVTVRLEKEVDAPPPLSGQLLGLPARAARPDRGLEVRARALSPGRALASVTTEELLRAPHVAYVDGTSDEYAFDELPPGAYAVAVVHGADVGPAALATVAGDPARVDLQVPPSGALSGEALRIRLRDARGHPVARRAVELRRERAGLLEVLCAGETDDAGAARLLLDRGVLEAAVADGAALQVGVRIGIGGWVYHLAPGPFVPGGEQVVVVPDPAVLVVTVPPTLDVALGDEGIIHLTVPGANADDVSLGRERVGRTPAGGRLVLGPVGAGAAVLHVLATSGGDGAGGFALIASIALDLPPGVTELELPAVAARALRARAPGPGTIQVVPGGGYAPTIEVGADGVAAIPRAAVSPIVLAFIPEGGSTVAACALAPRGLDGEITLSADQGRGLRVVVLRQPRAEPGAPPLGLEQGDVIEAVDGIPVEDALRPFGDRLAPGAPTAPLRLTIRRGDRALEVEVAPRALRAAIETAYPPFVGPAPVAE